MSASILGLTSGLVFAFALPNEFFLFGNPWLAFAALVPLFSWISRCASPGPAMLATAVFGGVSTMAANYWLMFFKDFAYLTIGSVTLAYTVIYGVIGAFLWRFGRPGPYRPFLLAAVWVVFEYVKSIGFLAYPWGLIAYPFGEWLPLLQIADIAGIWPISFLAAFFNALVAEGVSPSANRFGLKASWIFCASLFAVFLGYGAWRMSDPVPVVGNVNAVLVQQNIDPWITGKGEETVRRAQDLSKRGVERLGGKADIVIWSESSLTRPYKEYRNYYAKFPHAEPFSEALRRLGAPLLTGNPVMKNGDRREIQNGVVLISPEGEVLDTYGKRHPVPMAEYVPFWEFSFVREFFQKVVGLDAIWTLGDRDTIFELPAGGKTLRFGAPICFEDAFPYLCRRMVLGGADFLVNLTNDSWSRTKSAQVQHFVVARFRSIEMKRELVRSTNAGVTCVVGPYGEIVADLPMFEENFLATGIPIHREAHPTFYTLFGDYLPLAFAALLVLVLLFGLRSKKADA